MKSFVTALCLICGTVTAVAQHRTSVIIYNIDEPVFLASVQKSVSNFLSECNSAKYERRNPKWQSLTLTSSAQKSFSELWTKTNGFECRLTKYTTDIVKREFDDKYEIRGIPLTVSLENGELHEESGIVVVEGNGTIDDILLGLETERYAMLTEGKSVSDFRRRQLILNFVEIFRTAYNRKDVKYLQDVFSDNALIIVGKIVEIKNDDVDMLGQLSEKQVVLIKKSKSEYMQDLKKAFSINKFIQVEFDSIAIVQHKKYEEIYGVTMVQHWRSSIYSDVGYLFLVIDFKDEAKPIIYVRSWQNKEYTRQDEVIKLSDFSFE